MYAVMYELANAHSEEIARRVRHAHLFADAAGRPQRPRRHTGLLRAWRRPASRA